MAAWENDVSEDAVTEEEMEHVYASLYHAHIPKLVELGIVAFDRETETVERGENAAPVLQILEVTRASDEYGLEDHARGSKDD